MMRLLCIFTLRRFCFLIVSLTMLQKSEACTQQYKKELRYLKFYLGIVPAKDDGKLSIKTNNNQYIHHAHDLNCDFDKPCSWDNVPSDEHLDTSDFYLFKKEDKKAFPVQVRPGPIEPTPGTHMLMAGNTTQTSQSAVLVSSPIACQVTKGTLNFKYWLYNFAKIEVVVMKINPAHNRLQVLYRPKSDCTFFKASGTDCVVEVKEMHEPFKIGIRAQQLHDASVGSFAMITGIRYDAQICRENEVPSLFGGFPISSGKQSLHEIKTAHDLNCNEDIAACAWIPLYDTEDAVTLRSLWQSGNNLRYWDEFVPSSSENHPNGNFIFQYIDPMSTPPVGKLQSAIIPCTAGYSSLKLKYWMTPNVQAKLCTVSEHNVPLSCVFFQEENSPGPVIVDIDQGDKNPFRFVIEVIKFDFSRASIFAIDDITFTGRLCHEQAPKTTPAPLGIEALFELQPFPRVTADSLPESLDCNFEVEHCTHWENSEDGFQSAFIPAKLPFSMPKNMRGNAAVAHFTEPSSYVVLQSPVIACADNARITVNYFSSIDAKVSICADDKCLKEREQNDEAGNVDEISFGHAGELSVNVTSNNNFQLRIVAESTTDGTDFAEAFVVVKYIKAEGNVCRLKDKTELACEALFCDFRKGNLCKYTTALTSPDDTPFEHDKHAGLTATLSTIGHRRVVLRSPKFELSQPADLRFHITLSTFGATAYICPDEFIDNLIEECELLLGPKIDQKKWELIQVQLDSEIQHFAIVVYHDKYQQFGKADVAISDVSLVNADGSPLCVKS